jgi:hypothetical protein
VLPAVAITATAAGEVSHKRWQAIILALQPVVSDRRVLAFNDSSLVEAFAECSDIARCDIAATSTNESYNRHRRLLPAHRERPRSRSAEQRDELVPLQLIELHSVTASAAFGRYRIGGV